MPLRCLPGLRRRYRLLTSTDITKGYTDCNVVALARERRGTGTAADNGTTHADVQIPIRKSSCPLPACGGHINSQLKLWIPSHHTGREHQHGGVQSPMRRCVSPSPWPCLILDIPVGQLARGLQPHEMPPPCAILERDHRDATAPAEGLTRAIALDH
jgi:hypothetical protein